MLCVHATMGRIVCRWSYGAHHERELRMSFKRIS